MDNLTYTKGCYTATAAVRPLDSQRFQGIVSLMCEAASETESTLYEVDRASATAGEALEQASALAHRILGEIEF